MPKPDIHALVKCGQDLAIHLGVIAPPNSAMQATIEALLFDRSNYVAAERGLITTDELVDLVLAHLQTLMGHDSATGELGPLAERIERALCLDEPDPRSV